MRAVILTLFDGAYENNTRRARLLASNFLARYHAVADPNPKVIFKMGIEHTGLGTSTVNTIDLGALATEIATANGMHALRICFLPMGGQNTVFALKPGNPTSVRNYDDADAKHFFNSNRFECRKSFENQLDARAVGTNTATLNTKGIGALEPMSVERISIL